MVKNKHVLAINKGVLNYFEKKITLSIFLKRCLYACNWGSYASCTIAPMVYFPKMAVTPCIPSQNLDTL